MIEREEQPKMGLWQLTRRMSPFLEQHRARFALGVVLVLVSTGLEVALPLWIGKVVDRAVERNRSALTVACEIFLGLTVAKALLDVWLAYLIQSTGQSVMHTLREEVFGHILRLPVAYFDRNPTGRLLTRVMNDIKSLGELFTASLSVLILDVMVILGTVIAMLFLDFWLGGAILLSFPAVVWVISHFGARLNEAYRVVRTHLSHINAFLGENIGAIATIQRLAAEEERKQRFDRIVDRHLSAQMDSLRVFARVQPYANVLNGVAMATLLGLGGYFAITGRISLGVVVTFLGYVRNLFQPVRDLVEKYNNFLAARVSAERIGGILGELPEDTAGGATAPRSNGHDAVVFENVSFAYPSRAERALTDVSFRLPAGHRLAVVGPTGSGKSTIIRLCLRFYEPLSGGIYFEGRRINEWNRPSLRRRMGVIHQEVYLMDGTLRENLCLGEPIDDEALIQALTRCQLWELVSRREGLDMRIYEGGNNLSIGERQLVSFARVMAFDPPTIILDEATASLDRRLERRLMNAISEIIKGRTSIVVAHRLSTIESCDHVLVLRDGRVEQWGTFLELAREPGLFREFVQLQGREGAHL